MKKSNKGGHNKINLIGQTFGKLKVIEEVKSTYWNCLCSCGELRVLQTSKLRNRGVDRCKKCMTKLKSKRMSSHGKSKTKLYNVWNTMKQRCSNPNVAMYYRYGGRGIKVCDDWNNSYTSFEKFALNNGYSDGMSIDRIDNSLGYSPLNCRFVALSEQSKHRECVLNETYRREIRERYINEDISQRELGRIYGVDTTTISNILKEKNIFRDKRNQYGVWNVTNN